MSSNFVLFVHVIFRTDACKHADAEKRSRYREEDHRTDSHSSWAYLPDGRQSQYRQRTSSPSVIQRCPLSLCFESFILPP